MLIPLEAKFDWFRWVIIDHNVIIILSLVNERLERREKAFEIRSEFIHFSYLILIRWAWQERTTQSTNRSINNGITASDNRFESYSERGAFRNLGSPLFKLSTVVDEASVARSESSFSRSCWPYADGTIDFSCIHYLLAYISIPPIDLKMRRIHRARLVRMRRFT